ncbi:ISAs1 family transposase [Parabacteroides sp. APC149_11_2_Y6]
MSKIQNISEIHPTLGFTEFDILEKYRKSSNESELDSCITTTVKNLTTKKMTKETQYFISSLELDARLAMDSIRKHWNIENNLHWQLDVSFREDFIRMDRKAMMNLSALNKLALPVLKMHPAKISIKRKIMAAAMNDKFLE